MSIKPNLINDYHLLSYDELDSTNDEARRLAEGGGAHGAVVWASRIAAAANTAAIPIHPVFLIA